MTWVHYFMSQLLWVTEAGGSPGCKSLKAAALTKNRKKTGLKLRWQVYPDTAHFIQNSLGVAFKSG